MRPTTKKLLALTATAALGLAACGGDDAVQPAVSGEAAAIEPSTTTTTEAPAPTASDASADDPASTLRATLTSLLQEHVYLAGAAVDAAIDAGADDEATGAALDALDENTEALGEVIAQVPGVDDPDDFVELWSDHIDLFVEYAAGQAEGDEEAVQQARADLEDFQQSAADLLDEITEGELVSDEVFGELETHVMMVTGVVDALVGEGEADAGPSELLRDAADHMEGVAATLADGIVAAHDDAFAGDPASVPAQTRADLTAALQEHAYLLVLAAAQASEAGAPDDPAVQDVVGLVQSSSEDLANVVAGAVGNDARRTVLDAWRAHVDALLGYVEAATTGGDTAAARAELDATGAAVGAVLGEVTGGVADVGGLIDTHVQTITAAVDAAAAGDPTAPAQARAAAQVMPQLAAALAPPLVQASAQQDEAEGQGSEGASDTDADATAGGATEDAGTTGGAAGGATGGTDAGGDATGGTTEDTEPPGSPAEDGSPEAEGG